MAPARQRGRRENETSRRVSVANSEDEPVCGTNVPFEELLARELRKSQDNGEITANGKTGKKPFLKKGARGWWMKQPGARRKVVKHTLTSAEEDEKPQRASPSSSRTLSPVTTPEQKRVPPLQTLSPPVSPIRRPYSADMVREVAQDENISAWKNVSTASADLMGMRNVRQSFEAKQQQEANEMAEFEAIERDLAAEKEAYLLERQRESMEYQRGGNQEEPSHWGLPYSSFASDLRQQEQLQQQSTSIFDDSLDDGADSAIVFHDRSSLPDANGLGHYDYPPSELSAISFDDSVPWDDGLSFQPRESLAPSVSARSSVVGPTRAKSNRPFTFDATPFEETENQVFNRNGGTSLSAQEEPTMDAPVSSLVQQVFGGSAQEESEANGGKLMDAYDSDVTSSGHDNQHEETAASRPLSPTSLPTQDTSSSLSTLKQKLRGKQKPAATTRPPPSQRRSTTAKTDAKRGGPAKAKSIVPPRTQRGNTGKAKPPQGRMTQTTDSGMILPAVIEEKLFELEEEVKFYKSETLQLQKRKDYYDQEVKKLARERDEFEQYKQEQRLLIEKEWEKERAKMKKEEKLQERQWKLRMNATISHQDRKDRGEVETLKAQIVKMQLDEKAHVNKWKAASDNLRQRVADLETKNRELSDEIKFLEKDRLEQWEKYERLLKEKHDVSEQASPSGMPSAAAPSSFGGKGDLRTVEDIYAIKGTAEELMKGWNFSPDEGSAHGSQGQGQQPASNHSANEYNPQRYSLDRDDPHSSEDSWTFTGGIHADADNNYDSCKEDTNVNAHSNGAIEYQWALPDTDGDMAVPNGSGLDEKAHLLSRDNDKLSGETPALQGGKSISQEIEHPGGKKEILYTNGSKTIVFPDGNEKDIDASGHIVIRFTNGDHKEIFPDTGISVYYYFDAQTKLTTYPDNRKVYEFPNQQIETTLPDGTTEIQFADGITKTIRPNGDEFSVFPDGTTMLEQPDGLREVTLLNQKKIRYFPDGEMACVNPSGQETRVRSDSELKKLMEST